jgi:hypothetical protein
MYWFLLLLHMIGVHGRTADHDYAILDAASPDSTRPAQIVPIAVAPDILDELALLADTLQTETVRCLMGSDALDSIFIDVVVEPPIIQSVAHRVRFQRCPVETLAIWHNHVAGPDSRPARMCGLSQADIREALKPQSPRIMIVQVNSEEVCWWSKSQIEDLRMGHGLPALPHQRSSR